MRQSLFLIFCCIRNVRIVKFLTPEAVSIHKAPVRNFSKAARHGTVAPSTIPTTPPVTATLSQQHPDKAHHCLKYLLDRTLLTQPVSIGTSWRLIRSRILALKRIATAAVLPLRLQLPHSQHNPKGTISPALPRYIHSFLE